MARNNSAEWTARESGRYEIQGSDGHGNWDASAVGNTDNDFASIEEAEQALAELLAQVPEFRGGEYRIAPIYNA